MPDLFDTPPALPPAPPVFSVSEISRAVKKTIEGGFADVRVRGEISQPKHHSSGHLYFTLKDSEAVLNGICWHYSPERFGLAVEEGMEVICTGRLTTYPQRSNYQIVVQAMELAGQGALLKLLEERKKRLAAEGLFDTDRKKPIPFLPRVVGVVTSPTGAVIRDIVHRIEERFPCRVLVWPVAVQGDGAAAQIAAAIEGFNALAINGPVPHPDVLIVARGGGSLEDLMPFNDESVVRAAAASTIPLISAVGHETDTTLIDLAADLRAPTPTAAAEKAVPVKEQLAATVADTGGRLAGALHRLAERRSLQLSVLAHVLNHPKRLLEMPAQKLDVAGERLAGFFMAGLERRESILARTAAHLKPPQTLMATATARLEKTETLLAGLMEARLEKISTRLALASGLLESCSHQSVLKRGFALVKDAGGHLVTAVRRLHKDDSISLVFADGSAEVKVQTVVAGRST